MMVTCQDWRDAGCEDVAALFDAERQRWAETLRWDMAPSFAIVEQGRLHGHVPGWIARGDDGSVEGWTYYILHDGTLQIGGLTASRPAVVRRLLDAIMTSAEADLARRLSCFVFPQRPSVASAFERQRFVTSDGCYLLKPLDTVPCGPGVGQSPSAAGATIRPWRASDLAPAVRLLASSYKDVPGAACFAPDGRLEQWAQYATQLTRVPACGTFDPTLSFVVTTATTATTPSLTEIHGLVMTTRLSHDTAHVAQLAVAPAARRTGVARQLLHAAFTAAREASLTSITLMVDAQNAAAGSLYGSLGFTERARFLYGTRAARNRVAAA
jgi:ribosomal protein S18 acetylase RimI-like enzyme